MAYPLMPNDKLYKSAHLVAFHHPRPAYPLHLVLMPVREIHALPDLNLVEDTSFMQELFITTAQLVKQFDLADYRLVCNGGSNQDFPLLHFHLISEHTAQEK